MFSFTPQGTAILSALELWSLAFCLEASCPVLCPQWQFKTVLPDLVK